MKVFRDTPIDGASRGQHLQAMYVVMIWVVASRPASSSTGVVMKLLTVMPMQSEFDLRNDSFSIRPGQSE